MKHKIAFIAPNKKLADHFDKIAQEMNKKIPVYIGDLEKGAKKAVELEEQGFDVIISRGGTAIAIEKSLINVPVVEIRISGFDLIRIIYKAMQKTDKIAVVGFEPFTSGIKQLGTIMNIDLKVLSLKSEWYDQTFYINEILEEIKNQGYNYLVGDNISVKIAREIGLKTLLIESGKESITQAIINAEDIADVRKKEIQRAKFHKSIIDFSYEGIISIDEEGMINTFNPKAEEILNKKSYKVIGENIDDIFPEFNLKKYLASQHRKQGKILTLSGKKIAANIIPIIVEGKTYGLVTTFQKISDIQQVEKKARAELFNRGYTAQNSFADIIGESEEIQECIDKAKDYSQVDLPLLIYGETGTGKELFAQAVHNFSSRKNKPFVAFNCAALPEKLIESELFGYVEGAFTGAHKGGRKGLLEQAHTGTLLLDEIGEISQNLQAKLLRFIEERKIRKIGDNKLIPVNVRIILSTNKSLAQMVKKNEFREDLYYRINVLDLNLPPLRSRKVDIDLLVDFFIKKANSKTNKMIKGISKQGLNLLENYDWPGNIRQLENVIEKLVIRTKADYIMTGLVEETIDSLNTEDTDKLISSSENMIEIAINSSLEEIENKIIREVLDREEGNKTKAAKKLDISRSTIWRKLKNN